MKMLAREPTDGDLPLPLSLPTGPFVLSVRISAPNHLSLLFKLLTRIAFSLRGKQVSWPMLPKGNKRLASCQLRNKYGNQ